MSRWIKHLFRRPFRPATRPTFRPSLLALEERITPAVVTSTADDGSVGTLRSVIAAAKPGDTITFDPGLAGKTITLGSQIQLGKTPNTLGLKIDGGTNQITISGGGNDRIFEIVAGSDTIQNLTLASGKVIDDNGGAIKIDQPAGLTLTGDNFNNNSATNNKGTRSSGGAIENDGMMGLTVTNCNFNGNSASYSGGAIDSNSGANVTITGSSFVSNTANSSGGALWTADNTTLTNDVFGSLGNFNTAATGGGAVEANAGAKQGTTTLNVTGCTFIGNQVTNTGAGNGGAIETSDVTDVETSTFTSNKSVGGDGGAIAYSFSYSPQQPMPIMQKLTVNQDTFSGNQAADDGGAIYSSGITTGGQTTVSVTSSTFYQNTANRNGGGFAAFNTTQQMSGASITLINDTFFQNTASGNGGGVWLWLDNSGMMTNTATLTSNTITGNTAGHGTGLWVHANDSKVSTKVTVDNNIIDANGGSGNNVTLDTGTKLTDAGYNLVGTGDDSSGFTTVNHDILNNTTGLATSLANNGAKPGYPQTLALLASTTPGYSPGYRTGDPGQANKLDERGLTRQNTVSIGAEDPDAK